MQFVTQLRDAYPAITAKGAEVAAIGMGWPAMAAHFRDEHEVPFPLLVDHDKKTYRMIEMKRGSTWEVMGPPVWWRGIKGLIEGHLMKKPKQDPFQMGGVAVVAPGGTLRFVHRSSDSSDNAPVERLLEALD